MNDKVYPAKQKPISEMQEITMRLARLDDELVRLEKEKIDVAFEITTLNTRKKELSNV